MLTASEVIEAPFRLIRERPGAVAGWGLVHLAVVILSFFAMRPMQAAMIAGGPQAIAAVRPMFGWLFLLYLALFLFWIVLVTAAQRAILRPESGQFFYLRLGMDELRMAALALVIIILSYIALVLLVVAVVALLGLVGPAGIVAKAILGTFLGLALFGALIWLEVRLSLAFPLTLLRRRIVIGESWRLTRGRFWTLFGAYLVLFLLLFGIWTAVASVASGTYLSELARSGFTPAGIHRASQAQIAHQLGGVDAMIVVGWFVAAAAGAVGTAVWGGALATAVRALATDRKEIAETFA